MPTLYQVALMLVRVFAGINLVAGITALGTAIAVMFGEIYTNTSKQPVLDAVNSYLFDFGVGALVTGIGLLVMSKKIARYASKG